MPARKRKIRHDENTRSKIQASQLVNRLTKHVLGEVDLSSTQVTAALGLLKKTLPDLQATTIDGEMAHSHYAISAEPVESPDEWLDQHKPN